MNRNIASPLTQSAMFRRHALGLCLILLALVAAWFLYLPGLGAPAQFDTLTNLAGLGQRGPNLFLQFVFGGSAGPLGRPLSLFTFYLQADSWPEGLAAMRRMNVILHLTNGLLVYIFCWQLLGKSGLNSGSAILCAAIAALLWLLMPLLVSANLFIIQRMTGLSAFFLLLGLVFHLMIRHRQSLAALQRYALLTVNIIVFTSLSVLSKENGALLPVLVLIVEFTVIRNWKQAVKPLSIWWLGLFLLLPLGCILFMLGRASFYTEGTILFRDFNAYERVLTQAVILWQYLFNAFVPAVHRLGPFQDGAAVYRSILDVPVLLSVLGWLSVIAAAWVKRKDWTFFSFAVFWYLGAHLLESTTIPLELYFEHRNYVPLIGPVLWLSHLAFSAAPDIRRWALPGVAGYALLLGFVLWQTISVWGDRQSGAQFWFDNNPRSARAALYLTDQLMLSGDTISAVMVMRDSEGLARDRALVFMTDLAVQCFFEFGPRDRPVATEFRELLSEQRFSLAFINYLETLRQVQLQTDCIEISRQDLKSLADEVLTAEHLNRFSYTQRVVHRLLGSLAYEDSQFETAAEHFRASFEAKADPLVLRSMMASFVAMGKGHELSACRALHDASESFPTRWPISRSWQREFERNLSFLNSHFENLDC